MKKEQFFRLLGELDDRFLEKYRQIDLRLSHKAYRKKRTLRILAVAACLALLIGVCVPVGMMIAQLENGPSDPLPSITLQSLAELETMREMIACEDEQVLNDYLHSITGGGAYSRQDLIDFLNLVDNTPYARFIDGEITGLTYNQTDKRFSVSTEAENGESMYVSYELGMSDVEKNMEKAAGKLGRKNLLSAPLSTEDGRLTLYTETREPSSNGDVIRWQGVLDGIAIYIVYWVADADAVDTAALIGSLEVADSITDDSENTGENGTTERPIETESQIDWNDIPEFVKLGYLNVLVYDEAGDLVYRMSAEALENVENKLYLDYVSGGTVVVEFYAAYNRSQKVSQYRCEGYNATMERIDVFEINSDVTVDVQADYYHYLRMTVQMDALQIKEGTVRENGFVLIGDHDNSNIEGWAMWKRLYICLTTELLDLDEVHHPSYEDYLALKASVDAEWLPMTEVVKIMGKPHGYDSAAGMRIFVWNTADGGQVCAWLSSGESEPLQWNQILTADYGNARVTSVVYYGSLEQQ